MESEPFQFLVTIPVVEIKYSTFPVFSHDSMSGIQIPVFHLLVTIPKVEFYRNLPIPLFQFLDTIPEAEIYLPLRGQEWNSSF